MRRLGTFGRLFGAGFAFSIAHLALSYQPVSAACTPPSTTFGTVTSTVSIPSTGAGTYRVWTRMAAANATNNSYMLEIDGGSCYTIGGSAVPVYTSANDTAGTRFKADSSNWVSKTTSGAQVDVNLSAGSHTFKLIGTQSGVAIDRLVLTQDITTTPCIPTGTGDNCANPPDETMPIVSIASPTANASVTSPISVAVSASDDAGGSGVQKVDLFIDAATTPTQTDTTSPYAFNNVSLSPGTRRLTVRATDNAGNSSTASITVNVRDSTPPTGVSLTQPTAGQTVSGSVAASGKASDTIGVTKLEFLVDGQVAATAVNPAPVTGEFTASTSLNVSGLSSGTHAVSVKAYDAAGNVTTSPTVSVTVSSTPTSGDGAAPTVSFASPAVLTVGTSPVIAGKPYKVLVNATDVSGVKQVAIQVDGQVRAKLTAPPFAYDLDTTTLTTGAHTLTAIATDAAPSQNVSAPLNLSIRVTDVADTNRNCTVNFTDISRVLGRIGQQGTAGTPMGTEDVTAYGVINFTDISAIIPRLGTTPC